MSTPLHLFSTLVLLLAASTPSNSQQPYVGLATTDCYTNNSASSLGYSCNGNSSTCQSFVTFHSATNYQTPVDISYLLSASAPQIADLNNVTDVAPIPLDQLVLVPLTCSCSKRKSTSNRYYQHDAFYSLKLESETYLIVANNTYQGLSTCQAMMEQNPTHDSYNLESGMNLTVPIRCACATSTQIAQGYKYLLSYLANWEDDVPTIAQRFKTDEMAVWEANSLEVGATIYPFTTILVPLKTPPTKEEVLSNTPPPPAPSPEPPTPSSKSNPNWVAIGIGIGAGVIVLCLVLFAVFYARRRRRGIPSTAFDGKSNPGVSSSADYSGIDPENKPLYSFSSRSVVGSLALYDYQELQKATGFFGEDHRIQGSVYRGLINDNLAAVKRMKGDVLKEINTLKYMNHSNLIRLSGFCLHEESTYLVFEFAENGSLHDWLHGPKSKSVFLGWKHRVQVAHDVADALNYLHNYTSPPCVHKDINSSNILLDGEFRAKITNFALARASEEGEGLQMTRHVVGTPGYMSPEYLEHGLISPKIDIFAFGVVLLELLSGKEAMYEEEKGQALLSASIGAVLSGEDVRDKLRQLVDPCLGDNYPFESAYNMAQLAKQCVAKEPSSRPTIADVFVTLVGIHSAVSDWDHSTENTTASSIISAR